MKTAEYTISEIKNMINDLSGMYDLARVVDPRECRILEFGDDGSIGTQERCYGVWDSDHRCENCSSRAACQTGSNQQKSEHFRDHIFDIQSNPIKLVLDDGESYDAVVELISVKSDSGVDKADLPNDRADENENHRAAEFFAHHDSLTKVLNAEAFYEFARDLISSGIDKSWVMIACDIMSFHVINDLFGTEKGNEVLIRTADLLRRMAVRVDGLCGRMMSDRFALLLPAASFDESQLVQIAKELREYEDLGIYTLYIHYGVYTINDTSLPIHVMCNRASSALRTIKSDARNLIAHYDGDTHDSDLFDHRIISSFDNMIESGRYQMYLQPLFSADGTAFGAEALVRCIASDGSVIPPARFITTLEQAGLIHELDMYIWEQAASRLSLWKGTERDHLSISVNMSARDFYNIDVYEVLTGLVEKYQIDADRLRLEITETAFTENTAEVNSVIRKLKDAGFRIEIDDFGKGYSSLSLLKDVHADILKLDMGFISKVTDKERNDIILDAVIGMAVKLGMDVISEGVETEEQLNALSAMGCKHFQGYYFSKPIPVDVFESRF